MGKGPVLFSFERSTLFSHFSVPPLSLEAFHFFPAPSSSARPPLCDAAASALSYAAFYSIHWRKKGGRVSIEQWGKKKRRRKKKR